MGYFIRKNVKLQKVSKRNWKTLETMTFQRSNWETYSVPEGFITNGASIPRIFWSIMGHPFGGNYTKGAILHDWLYMRKELPRKKCDQIFLEALRSEGVSKIKRGLMYTSVRAFGWMFY